MRILTTGSRAHSNPYGVEAAISNFAFNICQDYPPPYIFVNGDCPDPKDDPGKRSVDKIVQDWCDMFDDAFVHEDHKADWKTWGSAAGPKRNQHMVDLGASFCLAFPDGKSAGTRGCAKKAQDAGIRTLILEPEDLTTLRMIDKIAGFYNAR